MSEISSHRRNTQQQQQQLRQEPVVQNQLQALNCSFSNNQDLSSMSGTMMSPTSAAQQDITATTGSNFLSMLSPNGNTSQNSFSYPATSPNTNALSSTTTTTALQQPIQQQLVATQHQILQPSSSSSAQTVTVTSQAEKLKKLLKQIKYPCNIRSKDLAHGNAVVFIQIMEYFLTRYSNIVSDFFRSQVELISGSHDAMAYLKPVTDGGAASFLSLVMKVFNGCFKYHSPLSVSQFFDVSGRESASDSTVSQKSQLVIDVLTYGLAYQSQHLATMNTGASAMDGASTQKQLRVTFKDGEGLISGENQHHLESIQGEQKGEDELMTRSQVNDTPAFMRQGYNSAADSTPRHHHQHQQQQQNNLWPSTATTSQMISEASHEKQQQPPQQQYHPLQDDSNGGGSTVEYNQRVGALTVVTAKDYTATPSGQHHHHLQQQSTPMDRFHAQLLLKVEGSNSAADKQTTPAQSLKPRQIAELTTAAQNRAPQQPSSTKGRLSSVKPSTSNGTTKQQQSAKVLDQNVSSGSSGGKWQSNQAASCGPTRSQALASQSEQALTTLKKKSSSKEVAFAVSKLDQSKKDHQSFNHTGQTIQLSEVLEENRQLKQQVYTVTDAMKQLEARFTTFQDSLLRVVSELRQENVDLKAYVRSKLSSSSGASAVYQNKKRQEATTSLSRKSERQENSSKNQRKSGGGVGTHSTRGNDTLSASKSSKHQSQSLGGGGGGKATGASQNRTAQVKSAGGNLLQSSSQQSKIRQQQNNNNNQANHLDKASINSGYSFATLQLDQQTSRGGTAGGGAKSLLLTERTAAGMTADTQQHQVMRTATMPGSSGGAGVVNRTSQGGHSSDLGQLKYRERRTGSPTADQIKKARGQAAAQKEQRHSDRLLVQNQSIRAQSTKRLRGAADCESSSQLKTLQQESERHPFGEVRQQKDYSLVDPPHTSKHQSRKLHHPTSNSFLTASERVGGNRSAISQKNTGVLISPRTLDQSSSISSSQQQAFSSSHLRQNRLNQTATAAFTSSNQAHKTSSKQIRTAELMAANQSSLTPSSASHRQGNSNQHHHPSSQQNHAFSKKQQHQAQMAASEANLLLPSKQSNSSLRTRDFNSTLNPPSSSTKGGVYLGGGAHSEMLSLQAPGGSTPTASSSNLRSKKSLHTYR